MVLNQHQSAIYTRSCSSCGETKFLAEFVRSHDVPLKMCRECSKKRLAKYTPHKPKLYSKHPWERGYRGM